MTVELWWTKGKAPDHRFVDIEAFEYSNGGTVIHLQGDGRTTAIIHLAPGQFVTFIIDESPIELD